MKWIVRVFGPNWKTSLAALLSFAISIPQLVTAFTDWSHHQPADWRGALVAIIVAAGLAASKDADNHSTIAQVEKATEKEKAASATTVERKIP